MTDAHITALLERAESFIAGFEDDRSKAEVPELLADLRVATGRATPYTAGEWKVSDGDPFSVLDDYNGGRGPWRFIATTRDDDDGARPTQEAEANAKRIVQCVNAHDDLVSALRAAEAKLLSLDADTNFNMPAALRAQIYAAIAKATGSAA